VRERGEARAEEAEGASGGETEASRGQGRARRAAEERPCEARRGSTRRRRGGAAWRAGDETEPQSARRAASALTRGTAPREGHLTSTRASSSCRARQRRGATCAAARQAERRLLRAAQQQQQPERSSISSVRKAAALRPRSLAAVRGAGRCAAPSGAAPRDVLASISGDAQLPLAWAMLGAERSCHQAAMTQRSAAGATLPAESRGRDIWRQASWR
jgi:hypothetical protein